MCPCVHNSQDSANATVVHDACTVYVFFVRVLCAYTTAKTEATRKQEALQSQLQAALKDAQHAAAATARANDEVRVTRILQQVDPVLNSMILCRVHQIRIVQRVLPGTEL
jgi:lysozyme family protein